MSANVALACCRRSGDSNPNDLYPDADAAPLRAALRQLGADSTLVSWDDPRAAWGSFSHIVVSSTWDSVDRPEEYLGWTREVSMVSELVNPAAVIEWNLDKTYLRQLEASEVPIIPTTWVMPDDDWQPPDRGEFVIKPSVSAGGRNTARYSGGASSALQHVRALQRAGQTVMVQEYLSAIDEVGEVNLVFFDGTFSHAVVKRPVLQSGEGVVERPWERMAWAGLATPTSEEFTVAEQAMGVITDLLGTTCLWSSRSHRRACRRPACARSGTDRPILVPGHGARGSHQTGQRSTHDQLTYRGCSALGQPGTSFWVDIALLEESAGRLHHLELVLEVFGADGPPAADQLRSS